MLKTRIKQRAEQGVRVAKRLFEIETSIAALQNEDLLDLADIFKSQSQSPLAEIVSAEMRKRDISL
jgi:hypothetical protein